MRNEAAHRDTTNNAIAHRPATTHSKHQRSHGQTAKPPAVSRQPPSRSKVKHFRSSGRQQTRAKDMKKARDPP
jgi:hypothetical protein